MSADLQWSYSPLRELVIDGDISYGVVQPGSEVADGVPIVRVKDIDAGRIDRRSPMLVAADVAARHGRTALRGGELLVTVVGSVGETAVVPDDMAGWNVARAIAVLRPIEAAPRWLGYCIQSPDVRAEFDSMLNTTVQATLNLSDLKRLVVPMPPASQREAIVEVLGALDDKIAANRRMAEVADALTRARFEVVGRHASTDVPIADLARNPRELVEPSAVGLGVNYVGLEHVPRRLMWLHDSGDAGDVTSTKAAYRSGDVLFGKLRPYFHKVVAAPSDGICSTDILVVRVKDAALSGFLLAAASSDATVERCTAASEGTRMPRTSWKDLGAVRVPWPGETAAKAFAAEVDLLRQRVEAALTENRTLAELRDTLLPELMTGRLRVKDAEQAVGEVV